MKINWNPTIDKLLEMWFYQDNWDNNNSLAPPKDILTSALKTAIHFQKNEILSPKSCVASTQGFVSFYWEVEDFKLILEVIDSENIKTYKKLSDEDEWQITHKKNHLILNPVNI